MIKYTPQIIPVGWDKVLDIGAGRQVFWDDYLVDTALPEVYRLAAFNGKTYAAPLIREQVNSWSGPYEQNNGIFMDFNHTRVPAKLFSGIMDEMEYCGCITDQFYSAQKKREIPIRFMQKR